MNGSNQEKAISMIDQFFPLFSMEKKALPEKGQGLFCDEDNVFVSCGWILIYYGYRYN